MGVTSKEPNCIESTLLPVPIPQGSLFSISNASHTPRSKVYVWVTLFRAVAQNWLGEYTSQDGHGVVNQRHARSWLICLRGVSLGCASPGGALVVTSRVSNQKVQQLPLVLLCMHSMLASAEAWKLLTLRHKMWRKWIKMNWLYVSCCIRNNCPRLYIIALNSFTYLFPD